jgi:DNA-binding response OmpR family regulator
MLTARDTLKDKLEGFEGGADDYLVKPFALKEVEARLIALHKRSSGRVTQKPLVAGELSLDRPTLEIRFKAHEVKLPPKCIKLLETLMTEPGRLYSRSQLETAVWGDTQETSDTLRSHMHTLRRALVDAGGFDPIETVHGLGYRLTSNAPPQS